MITRLRTLLLTAITICAAVAPPLAFGNPATARPMQKNMRGRSSHGPRHQRRPHAPNKSGPRRQR